MKTARPLPTLLLALALGCGGTSASVDRPPAADAGPRDAGWLNLPVDAGPADAGAPDAGPPDAGPPDAGTLDAGYDAGPPDAGTLDAGPEDAGQPDLDAGPADAGETDAGEVDAGPADAGDADAGEPDAGDVDAGPPDAGAPDAGPVITRPFDVEGFGAATVGGWQPGSTDYVVTTLADDGPGSLRDALNSGDQPRVVTFAVDGTIALASPLLVPSNISVDGRGHQVTVQGKGFILAGSDNVILTNLAIQDVAPDSEDGVRIGDPAGGASQGVVLDHLRFVATGGNGDSTNVDEAVSVIFGSTDVTIAWCRFENWEKAMLFGNGDAPQAVDSAIRVTVHHSLGVQTGRRHPQARYGTYDFYDNFWDRWHMYGWFWQAPYREAFGMQSQDSAFVLAENNLFRRDETAYDVGSQADDATRCESGGVLEERGSAVLPGGTATLNFGVGCPAITTPWVRPYPATLEPADDALRLRLEAQAGNTL